MEQRLKQLHLVHFMLITSALSTGTGTNLHHRQAAWAPTCPGERPQQPHPTQSWTPQPPPGAQPGFPSPAWSRPFGPPHVETSLPAAPLPPQLPQPVPRTSLHAHRLDDQTRVPDGPTDGGLMVSSMTRSAWRDRAAVKALDGRGSWSCVRGSLCWTDS